MPGSIRKRGYDSYTVIVDLGTDPVTGKRRQLWRSVKGTKKQAETELVRILHDRDTGVEQPLGRLTVAAYLGRWLRDYVEPTLAPKTADSYRMVVRVHLVPALGSMELVALRPSHIQALYTRLLTTPRRKHGATEDGAPPLPPLSARSIQRYHQILHAALHQAVRWQLLVRNPADAVEPPRPARRDMRLLEPADARRLMTVADETPPLGAFVRMAILTGMRRGELLGLRWRDVDLERGALHVQQTAQRLPGQGIVFRQPKTRLSRRSVALSPEAVAVLRKHRKAQAEGRLFAGPAWHDHDLVFTTGLGTPLEPGNVLRAWYGIVKAAGLAGLRIHDLRHAHATLMLRAGVHPKVVSERLGHASVNITLDTYSHVLPGLQEAAAAAIDRALEPEALEEAR